MIESVVAAAIGYLAGSVPFAFVIARLRGVDLRRAGSGNVGASNVLRTTGAAYAAAAVCLDALKGAIAVLVAQRFASEAAAPVAGGLAAVIGHVYPVWLGFRGGRGVATAAGVFAVLAPGPMAAAAGAFVVAVSATRYVSAGSVAGALTLVVAAVATGVPSPVVAGAAATAALVVHRHRANLARLRAGTERRLGRLC